MEDKLKDLHTHSFYSDGDLSPDDLIKLAISKGIDTISITDHNTLSGNKNITCKKGMRIIPGIELTAKIDNGSMHILGYGIDVNNIELNNKMQALKNNSINSVLSVIEQIKKDYNIIFTYDEIKELVNLNHNLGRPDIAKLCVKNGHASSVQDAFNKYLNEAYSKTRRQNKGLSYEECIELILKSNGIPVLAHPYSLKLTELELLKLISNMMKSGLKGIEPYNSRHTIEETNLYLSIANKFNLLISGGTDFHGISVKPNVELGTGINNNICIKKLSILNYL